MQNTEQSVCAIVVTFNRCELLRDCLRALQAQTRRVNTILVVDNASTDNTRAMLSAEFPGVELLTLPCNVGGAGGFHAGMKWAREQGFDWQWLMDDDGVPSPDCLQRLLEAHETGDAPCEAILVPLQRDSDAKPYGFARWNGLEINITAQVLAGEAVGRGGVPVFHFVGPLLSRAVVEKVGLPRADFFIWFDDIEWALRAAKKSRARARFVPQAVFHHDFGGKAKTVSLLGRRSVRADQPPWKNYYGARNYLFALTRTRRGRHLGRDLLCYFVKVQGRGLIGDLIYEPDRWQRAAMRLRGICDGALGRMGKRVSP